MSIRIFCVLCMYFYISSFCYAQGYWDPNADKLNDLMPSPPPKKFELYFGCAAYSIAILWCFWTHFNNKKSFEIDSDFIGFLIFMVFFGAPIFTGIILLVVNIFEFVFDMIVHV